METNKYTIGELQRALAELQASPDALQSVLTSKEASERWHLSTATILHACAGYSKAAPKFTAQEARRSGSTWLITVAGMGRVFGPEPKEEEEEG